MLYNFLWGNKLRNLYFGGPSLHNYGFWANKNPSDICAELTSVPADHWTENVVQCNSTLENHFRAFETGVNMVIYVSFGVVLVGMSLCHCMFVRPFTSIKSHNS